MPSSGKSNLSRLLALDLAHEAAMVEDVHEVLADNRRKTASRPKVNDDGTTTPPPDASGESNMIVVGDYTDNRGAQSTSSRAPMSGLMKGALLGAGLLATGGLGAAIPILSGMASQAAPAIQTILQPGTNTDANVMLGDPIPPGGQP